VLEPDTPLKLRENFSIHLQSKGFVKRILDCICGPFDRRDRKTLSSKFGLDIFPEPLRKASWTPSRRSQRSSERGDGCCETGAAQGADSAFEAGADGAHAGREIYLIEGLVDM